MDNKGNTMLAVLLSLPIIFVIWGIRKIFNGNTQKNEQI